MSTLCATSLVSRTTGEARIDLHANDRRVAQLTPDEARAWALNILEAAEAAEQDAFLVACFREYGDVTPDDAFVILSSYRTLRDQRRVAMRAEKVP